MIISAHGYSFSWLSDCTQHNNVMNPLVTNLCVLHATGKCCLHLRQHALLYCSIHQKTVSLRSLNTSKHVKFGVSVRREASKDDDVEIPPPPPALPSTDLYNSRDDKNYISSKVIFSIKFIYWYSAVIGMSFIVCFCCIFRLRQPNTGVFGAMLLQNIHKLLSIEFEIEGEELLKCPKAVVVVLNHQSLLKTKWMMIMENQDDHEENGRMDLSKSFTCSLSSKFSWHV